MNNQQRKERAREQRLAKQREAARKEKRQRLLAVLGGAALLLVVGVLIAVISTAGKGNGDPNNLAKTQEVNQAFVNVQQSRGFTVGEDTAPLTMVEYVDPQCPFCGEFSKNVFPALLSEYVQTGKLKIVIKPLAFLGPDSLRAAKASYAADKESKGVQFLELLYNNQGTENTGFVTDEYLRNIAQSVGVKDVDGLVKAAEGTEFDEQLTANDALFKAAGLTGTPGFTLGKDEASSQKAFEGFDVSNPEQYRQALDEALT
jgi:protein-disulfide isomerase